MLTIEIEYNLASLYVCVAAAECFVFFCFVDPLRVCVSLFVVCFIVFLLLFCLTFQNLVDLLK